jgi:hypothetical protein
VTAATYTLQPAAPAIAPGSGTYTGAQSVTISTSDPVATVRYTLDGTAPTEASPLYSAPIPIATTTTVRARAFRAGWTPSEATALLEFTFGTLAAPTATPEAGLYGVSQAITLGAEPGAEIRYTLDGADPSAASSLYTAPLTLAEGTTTVKARAFKTDWTPSSTFTAHYVIDTTAPAIVAETMPGGIGEWNQTAVTVSFLCSDAVGVASCPSPVTVDTDGAGQVITATDTAGNTASVSVTINVDRVAPEVALITPSTDLTTTASTLAVSGTVSDALSDVAVALCNGTPATVNGGVATCEVALRPGRNAVVLSVRDAAGNSASAGVRVTRTGPATTLTLAPATRTLVVEESAALTLTDDFGVPATGAAWASSDPTVAALSAEDPPVVTALAPGETTVTATRDGLTATATLTVVQGPVLADGTTRWTVPVTTGSTLGPVIYTDRIDDSVPDLFLTERAADDQYVVHGVLADGTVTWREAVPGVPTFADEQGGLVATVGWPTATALVRVAGPEGRGAVAV